jgi:hypothetical protein
MVDEFIKALNYYVHVVTFKTRYITFYEGTLRKELVHDFGKL